MDKDLFPRMRSLIRLIGAWLLVACYADGIFVASSLSHPPIMSPWTLPHLDKLYHIIAYSGLTFMLVRALSVTCASRPSTSIVIWAIVMAMIYGAFDEFHQAFTPNRMMSMYDLLADATGAVIGAVAWLWAQRCWPMGMKL